MRSIDTAGNESLVPNKTPEFTLERILKGNFISTQMLICRKEVLKRNGFDNSLPRLQDWDLAIRLIRDESFVFCDKDLVTQLIRKDSISANAPALVDAFGSILRKYADLYEAYPVSRAKALEGAGGGYELLRDYAGAIDLYRRSIGVRFSPKVLAKIIRAFFRRARS